MNTGRLPNASYKSFTNLVYIRGSLNYGFKKTTHEYPNRDSGFIENLGRKILQGSVTFRVYNTQDNDFVDEFNRILNSSGSGTLVIPQLGSFKDMEVMNAPLTFSDNTLGYIEYTIDFAQTSPNQYPTSTESNTGFLDRVKDRLLGENVEAFNNAWNTIKNKRTQTQRAFEKVRDTSRELNNLAKKIEGAGSLLSDFSNTLSTLTNDTARLLSSPKELATQLNLGFNALEDSISDTRVLFDIVASYFGFSAGDSNAIGTGGIINEVRENQNAINNLIKTNALAIAYVLSTVIEYETVQELNIFRQKLKNAYDELPDNLDATVFASLEEIQVNANRILDRQVLTLATLKTIEVNKQPLGVLVYSLYGDLNSYDDIYNLNDFKDAKRISGEVLTLANV